MNLTEYNIEGVLIYVFTGTFSATESEDLRLRFTEKIKKFKKIIFDLTALTYIDTTSIGAMVYCLKIAKENGVILKLVGIQNKVKIIFDVKRASKIFEIYTTVEESIASFKK